MTDGVEWSGEPVSPQGMVDRAQALAYELIGMPTEKSHAELATLKERNPVLHCLTVGWLRDTQAKGLKP